MTRFLILTVLIGLTQAWNLKLNQDRLQNRRAGDNFYVACKVIDYEGGASDVQVEWYYNGKQISRFGSTMTIEKPFSNQLLINRPKTTDGGKYTCVAEIQGEKQELIADVSFVDPPKFVNPQEEQHPEEGTRAEIHCQVEGAEQLEVFWQFNGVTLDETSQRGYEFSEDHQKLFIPNFNAKKDDGIYKCNAAQFSSYETLTINVTGYARPIITVFDVPENNRGLEGQSVELKCGAVAKPKPSYKWYFENSDEELIHSDKHRVEEGLLIIESLNSEDIGSYKCIANNSVGSDERTVQLSVYLKPKVDTQSEYVKQEGQDVEIVCGYSGEGEINAKFVFGTQEFAVQEHRPKSDEIEEDEQEESKSEASESEENEEIIETTTEDAEKSGETDSSLETATENNDVSLETTTSENDETEEGEEDEEVAESKKWKRFVDDIQNERISVRAEDKKIILTIKSLSLEDAGSYQCLVSNEAGTTNRTSLVNIIHPPTLRHYTGSQIRSYEGHDVTLFCDVSAVPEPKWKWLKDGSEVYADGANIIIDSHETSTKLTLKHGKDSENYGKYTCHADNSVGVLEKEINVVHVVAPPTPSAMECKKFIYPNYAKCTFEEGIYSDEGTKPLKMEFLIAKMEEMGSDFNWDDALEVVSDFDIETKISNLTPSTQYMIKARATNEAGRSEYTPEVSLETTDPWAPQSPTSVKVECADTCVASWSAPNDHGSPLLKYKITLQELGLRQETSTSRQSVETGEINELSAETETDNETSDEKDGEILEKSGEILPTSETHEEKSNENENEEDETTNEEYEKSGEIERVPIGNPIVIEVPAEETELQLTKMKPHSFYKISITAFNEIGEGSPSELEHQTFETPLKYEEGIATSNLVLVAAAIFFVVLLIIDFICFLTNRCGVIACICLNYCNGKNSSRKQRDLEAGNGPENNRLLDSNGTR
ncbi:unnamed protein product [Caenorhabditis angaria]|uniref:Uncharacterized protein n=1 Tax=Caenorhabditis angaria TaxID=860376 RepID=A0A9P1J2F5_9PELO|nr:unnamed protein product [Caenorhabditis angaria]